jgi:hypothetical protein
VYACHRFQEQIVKDVEKRDGERDIERESFKEDNDRDFREAHQKRPKDNRDGNNMNGSIPWMKMILAVKCQLFLKVKPTH